MKAQGGPAAQEALPTSKLAIASLVFSLLICLPGLHVLIAGGLAIAALVRIGQAQGRLGGKTLAIVALVLSALAIPAYGVMAAIAIPNFLKFQTRSKMIEGRSEIRSLAAAEQSYFIEKDEYVPLGPVPEQPSDLGVAVAATEPMTKVGWAPSEKLRFSYQVTASGKGPAARAVVTADATFRDPDTDQPAHFEVTLDQNGVGPVQTGRHLPSGGE